MFTSHKMLGCGVISACRVVMVCKTYLSGTGEQFLFSWKEHSMWFSFPNFSFSSTWRCDVLSDSLIQHLLSWQVGPKRLQPWKLQGLGSSIFCIFFLNLYPLTSISVAFVLLQVCASMIIRTQNTPVFFLSDQDFHVSRLLGVKERI